MIGFVPHLYDIPWADDLNRACLAVPGVRKILPGNSAPYMKSRENQAHWTAEALPLMRKRDITGLLFANLLEDFHPAFLRVTDVSRIVGFIHGTHWILGEPGKQTYKIRAYEAMVMMIADRVLISTDWFSEQVPSDVTRSVVGLPLMGETQPPREAASILFNHRLSVAKGAHLLPALPPELRARMVITSPKVNPAMIADLRNWDMEPQVLDRDAYEEVQATCGYGLSLSTYDTFGYSVLDGFQAGLAYFVFDTANTACRETVIDEFRFDTFGELADKIGMMDRDSGYRKAAVLKQQEHQSQWLEPAWRERVASELKTA